MKAVVYGLFDPKHCVIRYIGKTIRTDEIRLEYHLGEAYMEKGWNRPVCRWIRKILNEDRVPDIIIIEEFNSEQEALDSEVIWIARLRKENVRLLNATEGGEGISGYHHTDEVKAKIAEASRNQEWNQERKDRISKAVSGERNVWFGKEGPTKGLKWSDESKAKLVKSMTGSKRPNQAGDNHWTAAVGRGPNSGKKFSIETRKKISLAKVSQKYPTRNGIKVLCVNDDKIYNSQKIAADAYGLTVLQISRSCRLGREYKGLKFQKLET